MKEWKPRPTATFDGAQALTPQEELVLASMDGGNWVSTRDLSNEIGMPEPVLEAILERLAEQGAVDPVDEDAVTIPPPAVRASVRAAAAVTLRPTPPVEGAEPQADPTAPDGDDGDASQDEETAEPEAPEIDARNYRQLYETDLRPLERDARIARAAHASGAELLAFCFDPDPQVIRAVLDASTTGLDHARLVAFHHRNPVGLEMLASRPELARDTQVQRKLLRNDQLPEPLLKRLLGGKPLLTIYKLAVDRDVPEKNRVNARALLRQRFASTASEERADLVVRTEGRCLAVLIGQTFDSRTTSILCARPHTSVALIQNLARFAACPPALLVHLAKLPMVKRQPQLRKLLLQHANMPSEMKRALS